MLFKAYTFFDVVEENVEQELEFLYLKFTEVTWQSRGVNFHHLEIPKLLVESIFATELNVFSGPYVAKDIFVHQKKILFSLSNTDENWLVVT